MHRLLKSDIQKVAIVRFRKTAYQSVEGGDVVKKVPYNDDGRPTKPEYKKKSPPEKDMLGMSKLILEYVMSLAPDKRQNEAKRRESWFLDKYNRSLLYCLLLKTTPDGDLIQNYLANFETYKVEQKKISDYQQKLETGNMLLEREAIVQQIEALQDRFPYLPYPGSIKPEYLELVLLFMNDDNMKIASRGIITYVKSNQSAANDLMSWYYKKYNKSLLEDIIVNEDVDIVDLFLGPEVVVKIEKIVKKVLLLPPDKQQETANTDRKKFLEKHYVSLFFCIQRIPAIMSYIEEYAKISGRSRFDLIDLFVEPQQNDSDMEGRWSFG